MSPRPAISPELIHAIACAFSGAIVGIPLGFGLALLLLP